MRKKVAIFVAAALSTALVLAGCGGAADNAGGASPAQPPQASENSESPSAGGEKILIATQSPLSGPQAALGDAIKSGAEFALNLKKKEFQELGFDLQLFPQDDQADAKQGVANAELLVSNPDVLGVIGHYNSGVTIAASVKYDSANLVMIAPTASSVQLTEEGKKVVHRICARDDSQGPSGARYAQNQLGVKTAFLIHDKSAYGQGIADEVKKAFGELGVEVLGYEGITQGEKDYSAVINQVVAKGPDLLYFGGIYPEGGILVKQARDKGFQGVFMGGDGIDSGEMIKIAGPAAEGVVFTSVAGDVTQTEEGKEWVAEYEKALGKKPESISVYGFDAMNVLLNGLKEAIKANGGKKPTREQVLEAVHQTKDFKGQFTTVTFDEKGDNKYSDVFIYRYDKDKSVFVGKAE
jgi:branched-chain amino acid transport system substrate-binding protein